jgi:hypothetical protein
VLGYQFSEPQDVRDVFKDNDLRDTEGKRPWIGVIGRFVLLALKPHYVDAQIMPSAPFLKTRTIYAGKRGQQVRHAHIARCSPTPRGC